MRVFRRSDHFDAISAGDSSFALFASLASRYSMWLVEVQSHGPSSQAVEFLIAHRQQYSASLYPTTSSRSVV